MKRRSRLWKGGRRCSIGFRVGLGSGGEVDRLGRIVYSGFLEALFAFARLSYKGEGDGEGGSGDYC